MSELHCDLCGNRWPLPMQLPALLKDFVQAMEAERCPKCNSATEHHTIFFDQPRRLNP